MEEDEEINILSDPGLPNLPLVSQASDLLNCEYTVHPQWLLDRPSANPDCWYNNSTESCSEKSQEDLDQETIGHITTENSITDESGWTEKEKNLLERGIEIFGKSAIRLAQFIGTKTASEIKYYLKSFYTELHPIHSVKSSMQRSNKGNIILENLLIDSQIPCTSEQVIRHNLPAPVLKKNKVSNNSKNRSMNSKLKSVSTKGQRYGKVNLMRNKVTDVTLKKKNYLTKVKNTKIDIPTEKIRAGLLLSEGEEVVKIKKKSSESSDSEVDIEDDFELKEKNLGNMSSKSSGLKCKQFPEKVKVNITSGSHYSNNVPVEINSYLSDVSSDFPLPQVHQNVIDELSSLDIPKSELLLEQDKMVDLEKMIHQEFFALGTSLLKSSDAYLNIRNHILSKWKFKKPYYVTKADVIRDLDFRADKNTLNRIHNFLEQIGAINYGCGRVRYVRPLHKLIKNSKITSQIKESVQRRRMKPKFLNNGEGGCTVSHGADGEIIDTTIVNEDPSPPKLKVVRKPQTYLIYCKPFSQEGKYNVKLCISALLLMDFHSHSSLSEVMGLIGGSWCPDQKTLLIKHYEPCRNIASSTTHCDMCPVSQAASAERIHDLKMDLLGWFHSHPTFAPEPSQQDLDTQQALQEWIGFGKPCVGLILAPFNRPHVLTPSDYRCMVVEKLKSDNVYVPYKFKVEIQYSDFDVDEFLGNIRRIYRFTTSNIEFEGYNKLGISFKDPYLHNKNITYMDKFISSARMTLDKYFQDDENIRQKIVIGIQDICNKSI